MRVAIDIRMVYPTLHGIGRYILLLLQNYRELYKSDEFILFAGDDTIYDFFDLGDNFSIERIKSPVFSLQEQYEIPRILYRIKPDVFHAPSIAVPAVKKCRTVITIHDMIPFVFGLGNKFRNVLYKKFILKRAALSADFIITDSQHTKTDVMKILGIPSEKIRVIYLSVEENFLAKPENIELSLIKEKFGIQTPYFFTMVSAKPHKNSKSIIRAFEKFARKPDRNIILVLGGIISEDLRGEIANSPCRSKIIVLDYVSEKELPLLYRGSLAFIYGSLYEGFGLTVLEAMVSETPVLSSFATSLPEVLGDAAIYFDPRNVDEIVEKMELIEQDKKLREDLIEKGSKRARLFSGRNLAMNTYRVYQEVMAM